MASYLKPKLLSIFIWWLILVVNLTDLESVNTSSWPLPWGIFLIRLPRRKGTADGSRAHAGGWLSACLPSLCRQVHLSCSCGRCISLFVLEQFLQAASVGWRSVHSSKNLQALSNSLVLRRQSAPWRGQLQVLRLSGVKQPLMDYPDPNVN